MSATADKTETPSPSSPPPSCDEPGCEDKPRYETTRSGWKGKRKWCIDHLQEKMGRYPLEDIKRVELVTSP